MVIEPYTDHILPVHDLTTDEADWRRGNNSKQNLTVLRQFFAMDKGDWPQKNIY